MVRRVASSKVLVSRARFVPGAEDALMRRAEAVVRRVGDVGVQPDGGDREAAGVVGGGDGFGGQAADGG